MSVIKMYNETHEKDFRDVFEQYWKYITYNKVTKEQIKSCQDYILKQVANQEIFMLLSIDNNTVVGFSIFQIDNEKSDWNKFTGYGFIREFFIVPTKRCKGLGKELAKYTTIELFSMGAKNIYLDTAKNARDFWLKCGFVSTGKFDESNSNEILIYKKEK